MMVLQLFVVSCSPLWFDLVTYGESSAAQELVNWVDVCCYSRKFDCACLHKEAHLHCDVDWWDRLRVGIGLLDKNG